MECLFCKIVKGEIPSKKVYEDDVSFAFLDINPCTRGHTLAIPKKHYTSLTQMSADDIGSLFKAVAKLSKAVLNVTNTDSFNMGMNDGKSAGQEVDHAHVHIIPRYKNDGGAAIQYIVRTKPEREKLDEIAEKIKAELGATKKEPKKEEKKETKEGKPKYDEFFNF